MVKFRYSMQSVLDIKYRLEDQAKGVYAAAKLRYEEEVEKKERLEEQKRRYEDALQKLMLNRLDFREIQFTKTGIEAIEDAIKKQKRAVAIAKHEMDAASERLRELMVERKTHEKLKEKALEEYQKESLDVERKETDEIVSYRFNNPK
ncbi:MAG: flagellar export protein FliJ [Lachnospiraceae bacterium]|jgi:flagellar FliJ protein|nr:flagellar export protein FliJ [Lachnospiraceae bacterium]